MYVYIYHHKHNTHVYTPTQTKHNTQVGSKCWIGSQESSYVLMWHIGYASKSMHFQKASEMSEYTAMLHTHFKQVVSVFCVYFHLYSCHSIYVYTSNMTKTRISVNIHTYETHICTYILAELSVHIHITVHYTCQYSYHCISQRCRAHP